MSISINWQPIVGGLIMLVAVAVLAFMAWKWWRNRQQKLRNDVKPDPSLVADAMSADQKPSIETIAYIISTDRAMGNASPERKIEAMKAGKTRDESRAMRIAELELKP